MSSRLLWVLWKCKLDWYLLRFILCSNTKSLKRVSVVWRITYLKQLLNILLKHFILNESSIIYGNIRHNQKNNIENVIKVNTCSHGENGVIKIKRKKTKEMHWFW